MSDTHERRGFNPLGAAVSVAAGLLPFRVSIPNPLVWLPRPHFGRRAAASGGGSRSSGGGGARTKRRNAGQFAGTSSLSEAMLSGTPAPAAALPPALRPKPALKPASDILAGALARAASQGTIHPLDTLKVRLQANRFIKPAGLSKIAQLVPPLPGTIPRFDPAAIGATASSLYKGVVGAASGAGIAIGAYFAIYGAASNALTRHTDLAPTSVAFAAGGIAAVGSSVVKVPLAVCIRSVQAGVYPNFAAAARSIVSAAGVRGLFTGYLPTVLEDVPDMAIKFAAYESMRSVHRKVYHGRRATLSEDFAMGAVAGAVAAAATTPLDVIKTNMMCAAASRPTMASAFAGVLAQGGPRALFRGVGARSLSNGINSAVFFCFFEALRTSMAAHKLAQAQLLASSMPIAPLSLAAGSGDRSEGVKKKP